MTGLDYRPREAGTARSCILPSNFRIPRRQHSLYLEYLRPEATAGTIQLISNNAVETGEASGCEHAVPVELVIN